MKDKSWINFIFCIVESSHAHQHCLHAWPTLIHGNSEHVAVRAGARERCLMNRSQDARSWSACSWLLYCSMQRVMFRPCTHMSDHDTWSNQKVTWSNTCPLRDWPYVMSRQNNQTERDQLILTLCYMNGAHFHGYSIISIASVLLLNMYSSVNSQNASDSHCTTPKITEIFYSPFEAVRMDMSMLNVNFQMAINIWLTWKKCRLARSVSDGAKAFLVSGKGHQCLCSCDQFHKLDICSHIFAEADERMELINVLREYSFYPSKAVSKHTPATPWEKNQVKKPRKGKQILWKGQFLSQLRRSSILELTCNSDGHSRSTRFGTVTGHLSLSMCQ